MGQTVVTIRSKEDRAKLHQWLDAAPDLTRVSFVGPKRSLPQNAAMHAALSDIASQKDYFGLKLSPEDWKILFLDALRKEVRMVPNLDGDGMVALGRSSSSLSKEEFSGLLSIIYEWGSRNGVSFGDSRDG